MNDRNFEIKSKALSRAQGGEIRVDPQPRRKSISTSRLRAEPISRIVILCHPADAFEQPPFVIHALIEEWRRQNVRVEIAFRIDAPAVLGLVVIPHFDITRWPASFQNAYASCPVVLNRSVKDISKRLVSQNLVTSPKQYDGPVIVKTDRNSGGEPERQLLRRRGLPGRAVAAIARRLPWSISAFTGLDGYRVYDHSAQVPWLVWRNPRLVVEKFLPERLGDQYALRQYVFFGSREFNTVAYGPDPIVKAGNITRRELVPETPPALRKMRDELGFDFGKFDYVIRDGQVVLFDANRTPTYNRDSKAGPAGQLILGLASGIDAFGQIR